MRPFRERSPGTAAAAARTAVANAIARASERMAQVDQRADVGGGS